MQQLEVNERIQVLVDFRPAPRHWGGIKPATRRPTQAVPRAFIWKHRRYVLQSLNLVHHEKRGEATIYYFSVSTDANTYKLSFNNSTLEWRLVEIWNE